MKRSMFELDEDQTAVAANGLKTGAADYKNYLKANPDDSFEKELEELVDKTLGLWDSQELDEDSWNEASRKIADLEQAWHQDITYKTAVISRLEHSISKLRNYRGDEQLRLSRQSVERWYRQQQVRSSSYLMSLGRIIAPLDKIAEFYKK